MLIWEQLRAPLDTTGAGLSYSSWLFQKCPRGYKQTSNSAKTNVLIIVEGTMNIEANPRPFPPSTVAVLRTVPAPASRWTRMIGGPLIIFGSILSGGWSLSFIPLGIMMPVTVIMNLCPAGSVFGRLIRNKELSYYFDQVDALRLERK